MPLRGLDDPPSLRSMPRLFPLAIALLATPACAQSLDIAPATTVSAEVPPSPSPQRLRRTVETLVGFGTRHTLSTTTDPGRGIGAARNWTAAEFERISKACGGCLTVERPARTFDGPRAPDGVRVEDVLAIQRGSGDPNRVVILAGHIDSRVTDVADATSDAPGANDDGSGTALVIEAARTLSKERFAGTIVYAVLSGEEQGLWGGTLLAKEAKRRGWQVAAMLNNDIVGGTHALDGRTVTDRVRVFSEGIRAASERDDLVTQRGIGGEDDSPSRALAKAIRRTADSRPDIGIRAFLVRRPDRFGRGGDHLPMLAAGYPAVRFTAGVEDYDHQHQDLRTEGDRPYGDTVDEMDFPYLARVTALNLAVARQLAAAPAAPATVTLGGAVSSDTPVSWTAVPGAAGYRLRWRPADTAYWTDVRDVPAGATEFTLPGVIVDDTFVGVSALSDDGDESLVTFGTAPVRR